jgi:hypothetical protein
MRRRAARRSRKRFGIRSFQPLKGLYPLPSAASPFRPSLKHRYRDSNTLTDGTGTVYRTGFIHFQLVKRGAAERTSRDMLFGLKLCAARAIRDGPGLRLVVFFASLKTLLIPTKATALRRNQRPRASFSLAGFKVTFIGRLWVTLEACEGLSSLCAVALMNSRTKHQRSHTGIRIVGVLVHPFSSMYSLTADLDCSDSLRKGSGLGRLDAPSEPATFSGLGRERGRPRINGGPK